MRYVLALIVSLALTGCSSVAVTALDQARTTSAPGGAPLVVPYADPIAVTGVQPGTCEAQAGGLLPDPACTPGSVGTTDEKLVCARTNPTFEQRHRPHGRTWDNARRIAAIAYGIPEKLWPRVQYDHRIPLALGGADDTSNLWPQLSDLRSGPNNTKDTIDTAVWRAVCQRHTVSLADAQRAFLGDWRDVLRVLKIPPAPPLPKG